MHKPHINQGMFFSCLVFSLILLAFIGLNHFMNITNRMYVTPQELTRLIETKYGVKTSDLKYHFTSNNFLRTEQAIAYIKESSLLYMQKTEPHIKPENVRFDNWIQKVMQKKTDLIKLSDISEGIDIILKTEIYILKTDLSKFEKQGTDFHNTKFSPERIGKPYSEIDVDTDYDFERLQKVEKQLENIDRKRVLRHFFSLLAKNTHNNNEIYMNIFKFLYKSSFHNSYLQPMYSDKTMVTDPLVLLELSEMRCGQVARIAVDIFGANGYKSRVIQAGGHVLAEIFFDGTWHYFDADLFGGDSVAMVDGHIPSMVELSKQPNLIDTLASYIELNAYVDRIKDTKLPYPSYYYFSQKIYAPNTKVFYEKTAINGEELNKYYGWNHYKTVPDTKRVLYDTDPYYKPLSIKFKNITINDSLGTKNYTVEWYPAYDGDNDLEGYRVFISDKSRDWAFESFYGESGLEKYRTHPHGYDFSMYERMYKLPIGNIQIISTKHTSVEIPVGKDKTYYITIVPFDLHGEVAGNSYFLRSNELKLTN